MVGRSRLGLRLLSAAVVLTLAGCGATVTATPEATATVAVSSSVSVVASPVATPKASASPRAPSPTPPDPAPAELIGSWQTMLGTEQVTLDLAEHSYRVHRGPDVLGGRLAVRDDEIDFSHSTLCEGTGTYRWSLAAGALTFTPIQKDACRGRAEWLDGQTYTKAP
jgi:hypothetical protein